jgi:hypothetical protein
MDMMWKRKCSLHNGLEKITKTKKGVAGQVEWLTVFFYTEGVVHHEFLHQGQTVNRWNYLKVLKHLRENVRRKRPQLWRNNS